MLTYVVRRVLYSVPVLIISTFLSFTFVSLAGDPTANLRANPNFSVVTMRLLQHKYHLDASIPVRYWYWVEDVFTHKLGVSLRTSQPIWPDITRTFGHTAQLIMFSEALAILLGVVVGIYSAIRQYSVFDYFFVISFALYARFMRASMLDVIGSDYVRTARAKGVPEHRVILRHVVRNALIPVVTVAALTLGAQLGGAIVTETVFSLDGMGFFFIQKLGQLDLYPVMAYLVVTSVIIIAFNLFADILYGYLDPRIRLS
jgi:ABC-type dipeptide/oligopeptide/nickel transport system permease component